MQNVEYKAELRDIELARTICRGIGAKFVGELSQTDTYYRVPDGRLKKREAVGEPTEYIFYHRINRTRAKLSHFTIYTEMEAKTRFGERPLPVWLVVKKQREIWMYGNVRLHLDRVERLGSFFEIEALVMPSQHVGKCHALVRDVQEKFGPALGEAVASSYSDMLALELETADETPA